MSNILSIEGGITDLRNPEGLPLITVTYKNDKYELHSISEEITKERVAIFLYFPRQNCKIIPNSLNTILLITDLNGTYEALGVNVIVIPARERQIFNCSPLGDDLEIRITPEADRAIRHLKH